MKEKKSFARKKSEVPTRIYSYRCLPPLSEQERVESQYRLAHQFRNALVEIERHLHETFRQIHVDNSTVAPALFLYEGACAAVDDTYDELRAAKSGVVSPDLTVHKTRLLAEKQLRKIASDELKAAKQKAKKRLDPLYEAARADARGKVKSTRQSYSANGLRHGTYVLIEKAIAQAARSTKRPLMFERYDGTGSIGTQLTETGIEVRQTADPDAIGIGMTWRELISGVDPRLRLGPPGAADKHPRAEVSACTSWEEAMSLGRNLRRHAARTWIDLRIASNPDRSPIFARFPVTLHRLPPKDSVIKWAYVVRRRIGRHYEWRFQLTLESKVFDRPSRAMGEGTCAIDLGWRRIFDDGGNQIGLRAGYLVDENGHEREIRVPDKLWRGMAKVYDLAAIRDKSFDQARDQLKQWMVGRTLPKWMEEHSQDLPHWRDIRRLASLIDRWIGIDWSAWKAARAEGRKCNPSESNEHRIEGDAQILATLQAWARQDRHLQDWQEHQRDRLIAHRRETWRVLATQLARTYATILVEDGKNISPDREGTMRLPDIDGWERPDPEDGDPSDGREQRRMSRLAAVGELRVELVKASGKTGAAVEVERTQNSTQECAWCGHVQEHFDAAKSITYTCEGCARIWDQDANAARNLLHRHGRASGPVPSMVPEALARIKPAKLRVNRGAGSAAVSPAGKIR